MRLVNGAPGGSMFRPAWNRLELFSVAEAEGFLKEKLEKAVKIKDTDEAVDMLVEISLGFAITAIFADRENTAYIEEMAGKAAGVAETREIEDGIEQEQVNPTSIDW
jgi:hypothetical protein